MKVRFPIPNLPLFHSRFFLFTFFHFFLFSLLQKVVLKLDLHDDKAKKKALKMVSTLSGQTNRLLRTCSVFENCSRWQWFLNSILKTFVKEVDNRFSKTKWLLKVYRCLIQPLNSLKMARKGEDRDI